MHKKDTQVGRPRLGQRIFVTIPDDVVDALAKNAEREGLTFPASVRSVLIKGARMLDLQDVSQ